MNYRITYDIDNPETKIKKYKIGIISCWNSGYGGSLHTFMVGYKDSKFYSENGYSNKMFSSLSKLIGNRKMIVGYWFIK